MNKPERANETVKAVQALGVKAIYRPSAAGNSGQGKRDDDERDNSSGYKTGLEGFDRIKAGSTHRKTDGGIVKDILTKSPTHPHGIKVRLESGEVGRGKKIIQT